MKSFLPYVFQNRANQKLFNCFAATNFQERVYLVFSPATFRDVSMQFRGLCRATLVLGISPPSSSTQKQTDLWHCIFSYSPSGRQFGTNTPRCLLRLASSCCCKHGLFADGSAVRRYYLKWLNCHMAIHHFANDTSQVNCG